jgi:hypothetical protein
MNKSCTMGHRKHGADGKATGWFVILRNVEKELYGGLSIIDQVRKPNNMVMYVV